MSSSSNSDSSSGSATALSLPFPFASSFPFPAWSLPTDGLRPPDEIPLTHPPCPVNLPQEDGDIHQETGEVHQEPSNDSLPSELDKPQPTTPSTGAQLGLMAITPSFLNRVTSNKMCWFSTKNENN